MKTTSTRHSTPGHMGVFIRRGPWGYQRTGTPATQPAHIGVATLAELPAQLAEYDNQDITGR
jgi:hypothetical protein